MKEIKKYVIFVSITCLLLLISGCSSVMNIEKTKKQTSHAIYKGIKGYGTVKSDDVKSENFSGYLFDVDGQIKEYSISCDNNFYLQNKLVEGKQYELTIDNGCINDLTPEQTETVQPFHPIVSGTPGQRTLKNVLSTALEPMGTTLYVYGGGWNFQDQGSAPQAVSLGVSDTWVQFYNEHALSYNYRYIIGTDNKEENPEKSFYPYGGFNEYYYAGLDCSGYMGWIIYNVTTTEDDVRQGKDNKKGYVYPASKFAKEMAQTYGLGTFCDKIPDIIYPGDIVSIKGHVWMCVGTCDDKSIVIIHSSATPDKKGELSGGVQLGAINPNNTDTDCEAYKLIEKYTSEYYPKWNENFEITLKPYDTYFDFSKNEDTGVFSWKIGTDGITDPDGYHNMDAEKILSNLFKESNDKNKSID